MSVIEQPGLFDEPSRFVPDPVARVVLLCGASGSGKTSLARRLGVQVLQLDDFYLDADHPDLPRRFGIVDWDDPRSWDAAAAMETILDLASTGRAEVPVYDIPTSRRTGTTQLDLLGEDIVIAEGIFAAELIQHCDHAGVLADAVCLTTPPRVTFWRRLLRDLSESRKPPLTLIRRGLALMRQEPELIRRWTAGGCRPQSVADAEAAILALLRRSYPRASRSPSRRPA